MGYPKHEYVPSTKKNSCWRCGQPREASVHQAPDHVPPEATSRPLPSAHGQAPQGHQTDQRPSGTGQSSAKPVAVDLAAFGGLPLAGTASPNGTLEAMLGQGAPTSLGAWCRVTNRGSAYFQRVGVVTHVTRPSRGAFKGMWIIDLMLDQVITGMVGTLPFKWDELEALT